MRSAGTGRGHRRPRPRRGQGRARGGSGDAALPRFGVASSARRPRRGRRPRVPGLARLSGRQGGGDRRGGVPSPRSRRHRDGRAWFSALTLVLTRYVSARARSRRRRRWPRSPSSGTARARWRGRAAAVAVIVDTEAPRQHRAPASAGTERPARGAADEDRRRWGGGPGARHSRRTRIRAAHDVRLWMRREEAVQDVLVHHQNRSHLPGHSPARRPSTARPTSRRSWRARSSSCPSFPPSSAGRCSGRSHPLAPPGAAARLRHQGPGDRHAPAHERGRGARGAGPDGAPSSPVLPSRSRSRGSFPPRSSWRPPTPPWPRACSGRSPRERFRVYRSDDVVGVELGGALKNVIAIAAGIVDGLGYGHNTVAALITRGLAEITRLAVALGGRPDTLAGLAGLGDLVLTCTGGALPQPPGRARPWGRAVPSRKRRRASWPRACAPPSPPARWPRGPASTCPSPAQMRGGPLRGQGARAGRGRADAAEPEAGVNS